MCMVLGSGERNRSLPFMEPTFGGEGDRSQISKYKY